ncbi:hypothetical protein MASR2M18_21980 [Ignavibacteria bacterium]
MDDKKPLWRTSTALVDLIPDNANAYLRRADARRNMADNRGAIADYTKTISLLPNSCEAHIGRGRAKFEMGDEAAA